MARIGARLGRVTRVTAAGPYVELDDVAPGFEFGPCLDTVGGLVKGDRVTVQSLARDEDEHVITGLLAPRDYARLEHQHNAADLISGTLPDARLPNRLATDNGDSANDYNALTANGWNVMFESAANRPALGTYYVEIRNHGPASYVQQVARNVATGVEYRRYKVNGTWYNWVREEHHGRDFTNALLEHVNGYNGPSHYSRRGNVVDITIWANVPAGGIGAGAACIFIPPEHRPVATNSKYFFAADSSTGNSVLMYYDAGYLKCTFARPANTTNIGTITWIAPD